MTDSPTVAPLMRNLAVLDSLLGRGARAGLPLPTIGTSVPGYAEGQITLQWDDVADLETWAEWLDVQVEEHATDSVVHVSATTAVDGAIVRLSFCRAIEVAA